MNKDFCIFILTHGRPDNVVTYTTLKKCGYTGPLYFVVDNTDKTLEKYYENFGKENVIVFDKQKYADMVDEGNNFDNMKVIIHARNACFDIADELGYTHFMELDDDYTAFHHRFLEKDKLGFINIPDFDFIIHTFLEFYKKTNFLSIAFAQGGDLLGGKENPLFKNGYRLIRKCMNSFLCSTQRRFQFVGSINEDVNTYITLGGRGFLFATLPIISLVQRATQKQKGGMTDTYLTSGTYIKAFHTIIMSPSNTTISMMHSNNPRIHHTHKWWAVCPQIISEKHKKQ